MSAFEEFLAEEEARALGDLRGSLSAAGEHFLSVVDVRGWVRAQPLLAVGVAGVCGIALARLAAGGLSSAARSPALSGASLAVRQQLLAMVYRSVLRGSGPPRSGSA